ncbi:MAG: glucose-6-phosphate dehydrogenase [Alphaproteobacteria bacterium]|nr:glucose-6-phosphate dehydrogenase [Alphaproteobacteria bacterium]
MSQLIPVEPFDCVVFGATGDLALRKLMPALYHRWRDGQIPENSRIVGASRSELDAASYRALVREKFIEFFPKEEIDETAWKGFIERVSYCPLDVDKADSNWPRLAGELDAAPGKKRVFYFALPPSLYGDVAANIVKAGLKTPETAVVLEKPIGSDLASARAINDAVGRSFEERQVFRIDHYLGKETVQNLLILRFANSIFEPVWNASAIDHVQITVNETVGAGSRAAYYDKSGALRDMVQNHLLQLLCLVAMEPPLDLVADTVRDEKIKVLRALRRFTAKCADEDTVRGQYRAGSVNLEPVAGYEEELGGPSRAETFVAIKAHVDNWRWAGVPFYLRTGKRMSERKSEIVIQFKDVAHSIVGKEAGKLAPTRLVIRLQPDEGVKLLLMTKEPGPGGLRLRYVPLNLSYAATFTERYPDAYERLLMAVVRGDLGLFMRRDEVEAAWSWVDGILEAWENDGGRVLPYPAGTDGPNRAAVLLGRDGREWFDGV